MACVGAQEDAHLTDSGDDPDFDGGSAELRGSGSLGKGRAAKRAQIHRPSVQRGRVRKVAQVSCHAAMLIVGWHARAVCSASAGLGEAVVKVLLAW